MNLFPPTFRLNRLMAPGCLLISISVGTACSSNVDSPQYKAQSTTRTEQTPAQFPPIEANHAQTKVPSQSTDDDSGASTEKAEPNQGLLQHNKELQTQLDDEASTLDSQFNEILGLYRRLHIELDDDVNDFFGPDGRTQTPAGHDEFFGESIQNNASFGHTRQGNQ